MGLQQWLSTRGNFLIVTPVGCYWHLVGIVQECCCTSYNARDRPLPSKEFSAQNVNGAKAEEFPSAAGFTLWLKETYSQILAFLGSQQGTQSIQHGLSTLPGQT